MKRNILSFLTLVAMLFSNLLMAPDVHAEQGESFAHAADHVYAHGLEHFDPDRSDDGEDEQEHAVVHHHNCSFNVAGSVTTKSPPVWHQANLTGPRSTPRLASRKAPVLTQPPKA